MDLLDGFIKSNFSANALKLRTNSKKKKLVLHRVLISEISHLKQLYE